MSNYIPLIGCTSCCSGKIVWYCAGCYEGLSVMINRYKTHMCPLLTDAIGLMLSIKWSVFKLENAPKSFALHQSNPLLMLWPNKCPACDRLFLSQPPPPTITGMQYRCPKFEVDLRIRKVLFVNPETSKTELKTIAVQFITVYPVLSKDEEKQLKARSCRGEQSLNYLNLYKFDNIAMIENMENGES